MSEDSIKDWYKWMKLDIDWLLNAAECLALKKENKGQKKETNNCLVTSTNAGTKNDLKLSVTCSKRRAC